ncbi:MAG: pyruvate kinase [Candidatus Nanohaloarchaea archaeon]|nr:pyruvate kinase [Candidatus Nanohaloarchaea archaeon]
MRNTKIVATIGPASNSKEVLGELLDSGMDVARQNLSHGDHEQHGDMIDRIREVSEEHEKDIGVMLDTQGPEIRLREVEEGTELEEGETVEIVTSDIEGDSKKLPVDYKDFNDNVSEGDEVLIDDGDIELVVEEVSDSVVCKVAYGGTVTSKKSVNVPGKDLGLHAPTEKDVKDIKFAVEKDFDFVALSFAKEADDIKEAREILKSEGGPDIDIIAKIEHLKAIENFDEILEVSDGIMVARGDLGVEMDAAEVPNIQKRLIKKCNREGKPVITATQMLKSMTDSPRATRAEVSDIANAVLDGTDAVMLSEETAIGQFPGRSLQVMAETVAKTEESIVDEIHHTVHSESANIADIICKNVWQASQYDDVDVVVAHTSSGYTARNIAKYRPKKRLIAFTDSRKVKRKLNIVWGVEAILTEFPEYVDEMICNSAKALFERGIVGKEDMLVLSAGVPTSVSGTTNMMEIRSVESLLEEHKEMNSS